jgi:argininosuccinate synthase
LGDDRISSRKWHARGVFKFIFPLRTWRLGDLQEEFARDFIYPIIQAGAIYEGQYFLGTSIARPLIAKRMVEIAKKEKADAIALFGMMCANDLPEWFRDQTWTEPDLIIRTRAGKIHPEYSAVT